MVEQMSNFLGKLFMNRGDYRKLAAYCIAGVIIYNLSDVLFDLAISFLHSAFEWLEFGLDQLIEHTFNTTRQQTQTIVFYLMLISGIFICYRFVIRLTAIYRNLHQKVKVEWEAIKTRIAHFWQHQSTVDKLKLVFSGSASFMVLAALLFS